MKKQEVDYILARMLDAYDSVSDLNITVGKPFQVETSGELTGVEIDPPFNELKRFAYGYVQIGNIVISIKHSCQNVIDFLLFHNTTS